VDESWSLPSAGLLRCSQLWCVGSGDTPLYRHLPVADRRKHKRAFSEWRGIFKKVKMFLKCRGKWVEHPDLSQCDAMYEAAMPLLRHLFPRSKRLSNLLPLWAVKKFRRDDARRAAEL